MQHNNWLFVKPSTFLGKQCNFNQVNDFCISQGGMVTFFRCGRQMHNHLCQISSGFHVSKIIKSWKVVRFWL